MLELTASVLGGEPPGYDGGGLVALALERRDLPSQQRFIADTRRRRWWPLTLSWPTSYNRSTLGKQATATRVRADVAPDQASASTFRRGSSL